jgi:hypothetical protein
MMINGAAVMTSTRSCIPGNCCRKWILYTPVELHKPYVMAIIVQPEMSGWTECIFEQINLYMWPISPMRDVCPLCAHVRLLGGSFAK